MAHKRTILLAAALTALLALAAGAALYLPRAGAAPGWAGVPLDSAPALGDVTLATTDGRRTALSELEAPYLLVFFGYTSCPDVCPLTMARLARVYRDLGEPDEVRVVMVTVDPATDTAERLQAYVEGFHPAFLSMRGSNQEVAGAALRFYVAINALGDGLVAHSDPVALLGPDRTMRLLYPQDRLAGLEEDLRAVLAGRAW